MLEVIRILQLGKENWNKLYNLPEYIELQYELESVEKASFDLVFVDRIISDEEVSILFKITKAYTLYVSEDIVLSPSMKKFFDCKKGKRIHKSNIQSFLLNEAVNYFSKSYGEKFKFSNISVANGFSGKVMWNGNYSLTLEGDYGQNFNQVVFWRNNIPISNGQAVEFWLEYEKDPEVKIALTVTLLRSGTLSDIMNRWSFDEEELNEVIVLENQWKDGHFFVSLEAKGKGNLKIIALHDRHSRRGHGVFIPGGQRYVTSNREEIFYYFDPGDMKPPLNIYFSGYKTKQGFEGYNMMRKLGCPFLLIAEPRLEGGCFYMGTEEYEQAIVDIIQKHMKELGFKGGQVIMSGISMGTFGAMYYGCDILPRAMILGKPLLSIGNVAENERLTRPGGFPTSLDVLKYLTSDLDEKAVNMLNSRFWDKFEATDWGESKFVVSYMIEDDYDKDAYNMLISRLKGKGVSVYGKGIHGRHNDATGAIAAWFKSQYNNILSEDFGRRMKDK